MIRTFLLMTGLLIGLSASAQTKSEPAVSPVQAAYEAKGIHFAHVHSMVQLIAAPESEPTEELLMDFLRTIETAQHAGAPAPLSTEWQNRWMATYNLTAEQVQDLYKVAVRFAFQPGRR